MVKSFLFLSLFAVLFFYSSLSAQASDDIEYWSEFAFSKKINEKLKLSLVEEFYLKNDMGNFYSYTQYAGMGYEVSKYFDTAIWYKLVSSKKNENWSERYRFDIDGTLKLNLSKFKLSNRSRFERNTTASSWLYRDRIRFEKPIHLFNKDFSPFVSNEFFLDMEPRAGYHENRAAIGFSINSFWGSKLSIYYMSRIQKKNGSWHNSNILGTVQNFAF